MTTFTDSQLADAAHDYAKKYASGMLYAIARRLRGLGEQPAVPSTPIEVTCPNCGLPHAWWYEGRGSITVHIQQDDGKVRRSSGGQDER